MKSNQLLSEIRTNFSEIEAMGFVHNEEFVLPMINKKTDPDDLEGLVMRLYFMAIDPEKDMKFLINQYEENQFLYLTRVRDASWFFVLGRENNFAKLHFFIKYLLNDIEVEFDTGQELAGDNGIDSARRIQQLLLSDIAKDLSVFSDQYFWYQPKEQVGGDFYWSQKVKNHLWLVVGDCTGHSVEGALASVSVLSLLQQVFEPDTEPHLLIKKIHEGLRNIQHQDLLNGYGIGCEMIVLRVDLKTRTLKYSGTGLPLYLIKDKMKVFKTKKSALDPDRVVKFVRSRSLQLESGDGIFTHCDGLIDQLSENGKRIRSARLRHTIAEEGISERSVKGLFDSWKGNEEQTDDVVCVYFKV